MLPQVLFISQNSRLRRLYHQSAMQAEYELIPTKSITEALLQLVMNPFSLIVIEESLPMFEVCTFFDVIDQKSGWADVPIIAIGFEGKRHMLPKRSVYCESSSHFVRLLKDLCATM
ncbi:MAG: hypothetical protein HZA34_03445 [Candidatus Pacebacteria bacterium]|nr:hypothetical protein [Candidatus Paceibacterota bacterium]